MAPFLRLWGGVALLGAATVAVAQDRPAGTPSETALAAEQKTSEWTTLASSLEPRVSALLPCDPRVRSAIEEVSRASEARFAALAAYWQEISRRSREQAEAAHTLMARNNARAFCEVAQCESLADWKADRDDSQRERARVGQKTSDLRDSAQQQQALASAARVLNGVSGGVAAAALQAATREEAATRLDASLNNLITAAQARETAVENELTAIATESKGWTAYYAVRITRAQMECSVTGPAGAAGDAAPRTPAKKAK